MLIDLSPLKRNRDFSLLYCGQFISSFGSQLTYVAVPFQVYQLTKSSLSVGMVSLVQLFPLIMASLIGGSLADVFDRRKLLLMAEFFLSLCCVLMAWNAHQEEPSLVLVYVLSGVMSLLVGLHRPTLEAITAKVLPKDEIMAAGALTSLKTNVTTIIGPGLAGFVIAKMGLPFAYLLDTFSYICSLAFLFPLYSISSVRGDKKFTFASIWEGFSYAKNRQEIMGSYLVDFFAMLFGMPMALFPAIAEGIGGAMVLGWLYAAPSIGALVANIFSGWTKHIKRHGAAIALAAIVWGLAIICFGYSTNLYFALFFLALAGAADMVSVQFRFAIWRQTIPDYIRGRMAGLEVISYTSGPLLGGAEAGIAAKLGGIQFSVVSGGVLCVLSVIGCCFYFPKFWSYRESK